MILTLALFSHALSLSSAVPVKGKTASLAEKKIEPPLKDVSSDKKFFGPPFPADYPDDKRPTVSPHIAWQLKEENKPYPYLQSRHEFDADYVKDENSDKGDWKAQFDYDAYRKKLADEEARVRRAQEQADKEGKDVSDAQKAHDDAEKAVEDAKRDLGIAKDDEGKAGQGGSDEAGDGLSAEEKKALNDMRKKVFEASQKLDKEKKDFEECQKKLEEAKKRLEDVKARLAEFEDHMAAQTKLWAVQKEEKKRTKQAKTVAAAARLKKAEAEFQVAEAAKLKTEEALAKEKADNEVAQQNLRVHKAKTANASEELEKARVVLQKIRGYKPDVVKSGALLTSDVSMVLACVMGFLAVQGL